MAFNSCVYTVIFLVCVLSFAWPLYIYFTLKWHKNRNHFVIRNRWPFISLAIITLAIITQLLTLIESAVCSSSLSIISIAITNTISGLVYYRAHLLYVQTLKTRKFLNTMVPSKARHILISNENKPFAFHIIWSKTILVIVFITTILVIIFRILNISIMYPMVITQLIGIISVINLLRGKVLDSIGICKESICQISANFTMLLFGAVSKSWAPTYIEINLWAGFFMVILYGFFVLFIPLHLIRKVNVKNYLCENEDNTGTEQIRARSQSDSKNTQQRQQGLSIAISNENQVSVSELPPLTVSTSLNTSSLSEFLNYNKSNYGLFAGYLSQCFALENLLFLERAVILYHMIRKYQKMDIHNAGFDDGNAKIFSSKCYELRFTFLSQIYADIEAMIEKNITKTETENEDNNMIYKKGIMSAMKLIYKQFCCRYSVTEINVSYGIINNLQILFENNSDDEILKQFKSYNDMLMVFHFSIME
eukprot:442512_1